MSTVTEGCVHVDVVNLCQELPWEKRSVTSDLHLACSPCSLLRSRHHLCFHLWPRTILPLVPLPRVYPPLWFGDGSCLSACPSLCFVQGHVRQPSPASWPLSRLSSSPPAADSPRFSRKGISLGVCEPASEPACHSAGQAFL